LTAIDQYIYANLVAGAQGYRWRVTTMSGANNGAVQFLDTNLRAMRITQLAQYAFNTSYKIEVAVYYQGFLQPFTTSNCTVTTPSTTTKLSNCGGSLQSMNDVVYANIVPFAAGYRFRISDPVNGSNTQVLDRPIREFKMTMITAFIPQYGKAYNVDVAVKNTDGTYLPYGTVCQLTTPLFPTTSIQDSQCDNGLGGAYAVPSMSTQIYAFSYPGAIKYVFKLTGPGMPTGQEVTKTLRTFNLNDFAGFGLVPGQTYNVNVRLIFNDADPAGRFGKTCSIQAPGSARMIAEKFNAVAYPNPFESSFNIDVTSKFDTKINVKVYDMPGRLLDNTTSDVNGKSLSIGERYPSGIYNVIVTQGEETKTLRLIKR